MFHLKTFLVPVPFPVVTTKLLVRIKNGSGLIPPTLRMQGMYYYYGIRTSIHIYIYIYIYRTSSNLYTPDSVSLARQLSLLTETSPKSKSNSTSTEYARVNSQALSSNTCRLAHEPCDKTVKQNHSAIVSALNNLYEDTHELEAAL